MWYVKFYPDLFKCKIRCAVIWATSWGNLFMLYANNKGADQPAHPRILISTFVVRCLDSIIPLVCISEISSVCLASVAVQAGLSLRKPQRQVFSWWGSYKIMYPKFSYEPHHVETCLCYMYTQTTKPQISLHICQIRTFVVRCLDSIISVITVYKLLRLLLASVLSRPVWVLPVCTTPRWCFLMVWLIWFAFFLGQYIVW